MGESEEAHRVFLRQAINYIVSLFFGGSPSPEELVRHFSHFLSSLLNKTMYM
jgi:hypothetical protein